MCFIDIEALRRLNGFDFQIFKSGGLGKCISRGQQEHHSMPPSLGPIFMIGCERTLSKPYHPVKYIIPPHLPPSTFHGSHSEKNAFALRFAYQAPVHSGFLIFHFLLLEASDYHNYSKGSQSPHRIIFAESISAPGAFAFSECFPRLWRSWVVVCWKDISTNGCEGRWHKGSCTQLGHICCPVNLPRQ